MAGILFAIGNVAENTFEECRNFFEKVKTLESGKVITSPELKLIKYKRPGEIDNNVYETKQNYYFVVGTLIYKDRIGKKALRLFSEDSENNHLQTVTDEMEGPFGLFVVNKKLYSCSVITDHAGIINLYTYNQGDATIISSSSMALSRSLNVSINPEGIVQFLRNSTLCDSDTIYNEIKLLEPASTYSLDSRKSNTLNGKRYWRSPTEIDTKLKYQDAKELLKNSLSNSFNWINDKHIVCDITAGYDSRMIISNLMKKKKSAKFQFETFVFGPEHSKEVMLVKMFRKLLDVNIHHIELPENWDTLFTDYFQKSLYLCDGEESAAYYAPVLFAQQFKRSNFNLSLNGLGGELYRDFWWLQEMRIKRKMADYRKLVNNRVLQYEYDYSIFSKKWRSLMKRDIDIFEEKYRSVNSDMELNKSYNTLQIDNVYFRQKIRRWAGRTISTSNLLIPTVAPLTFKRNLDVAMRIHPKYKLFGQLMRAVISEVFQPVGEVPMLNGAPCVPISATNAHKFLPLVVDYYKRATRKVSQKFFNKTILTNKSLSYEQQSWYRNILLNLDSQKSLDPAHMAISNLLEKKLFNKFIEKAKRPGFEYHGQLGTILTLELRMRKDRIRGS